MSGRVWIAAVLAVGLCRPAHATIQYDTLQLSGNFETQNLIRTPDFGEFQFIQNRNTARIRVDWDWLQDGRFVNRWDVPFIKKSHFYLLYRGVYDGFYDLAPGGRQVGQAPEDDLIGGPIEGNDLGTLRPNCTPNPLTPGNCLREGLYSRYNDEIRDGLKFENRLREMYIDVELRDIPLTLRLGRQQVIWGEADQFRLMDIWNPLDTTWRFPIADTFDDFRVPLWLAKGILDTGTIGPFNNTFVEFVYNPFDFQPGQKVDWLPRPWGLPFADPLRPGQIQVANVSSFIPTLLIASEYDLNGTTFRKGDFERNPQDASEVGVRLHWVLDPGIESTINYVYGRGKWVGTSPSFGVRVNSIVSEALGGAPLDYTFAGNPVLPTQVNAEVVHPYVHVFGLTANYFDPDWTQAVLRMETAYALGEPYPTTQEDKLIGVVDGRGNPIRLQGPTWSQGDPFPHDGVGSTACPPGLDDDRCMQKSPVGLTKRDVWAGMVGFDRPTWIRWLNNKGTWFISGQFFWVHMPGRNVGRLRGFSSARRDPYFTPTENMRLPGLTANNGFGAWDNGPYAGQVERVQNGNTVVILNEDKTKVVDVIRGGAPSDKVKRWEFMMTLTATTFYKGGTIAPQFVTLFDPINLWIAPMFELKWLATPSLILTVQQRIIVPMKPPTDDPWYVGRFGRRAETGLRLTYQF